MSHTILIIGLWLYALATNQIPLDRSDPEGIDLSNWKITLPVDANQDSKPDEYGPNELDNLKKNGKLKPYFYEDEDGGLVFYCAKDKGNITTKNSKSPRTELREQISPNSNDVNWTMETGGKMTGKLKITRASTDARFMVMQIHGRLTDEQRELIGKDDNDAPPLLKIYYANGKIEVAYKILKDSNYRGEELLIKSNWTDAKHYYFSDDVANNPFDLEIIASSGKLEVSLNGVNKEFSDFDLSLWPFENYFKAGNYLTTKSETAYSEVKYFHLKVEH